MAAFDTEARRVLRPMFWLSVFEDPYVDPENARAVAGVGFDMEDPSSNSASD